MTAQRIVLVAIAALQGLAFWWITENLAGRTELVSLTALIISGLVFHFGWTGDHVRRLLALVIGVTAIFVACAWWVGGQIVPRNESSENLFFWWAIALITLYVAGPFVQIFQRTRRSHFPYVDLFELAWSNVHVGLVGLASWLAVVVVLGLWGSLFDLVGIDFFEKLFDKPWFQSTAGFGALGLGVRIGLENENLVRALRRVTLTIFRLLLPILTVVALGFVGTLAFTGVGALWATKVAAATLLGWTTLTLLFFNAAYDDGQRDPPFAPLLRRVVETAWPVMVVFCGLAIYAFALRIGQHGLTTDRFLGCVVAALLSLYAIGYSVALVRRGAGTWLPLVQTVNRGMAVVLVVTGLLLNTPLLDPKGWAAESQVARLVAGRVTAAAFDYGHLHFELGKPGQEALARLEAMTELPDHAAITSGIAKARASHAYFTWQKGRDADAEHLELLPAGQRWPEGLQEAVLIALKEDEFLADARVVGCRVLAVDIAPTHGLEYVVTCNQWGDSPVLARIDGHGWRRIGHLTRGARPSNGSELYEAADTGAFSITAPPVVSGLQIGESSFYFLPAGED